MRARDGPSVNLRNQVISEAEAADQLENESESNVPAADRAPPSTSVGSRSSFTEQPEPPNYSIEIEHVFKVYGPYAEIVTPFFSELWQQHAQSDYAASRLNVQHVRHQARSSDGVTVPASFINPSAHPQLRMGQVGAVPANDQQFITMVMPFFDTVQREAQDTNYLNARRDEFNEITNALRIFAPDGAASPLVSAETLGAWHTRLLALVNTPPQLALPSVRAREIAATQATTSSSVTDTLPSSDPPAQRRRTASPNRTVFPENSMTMVLQGLQSQFEIVECGGGGHCTFHVLNVIEFTLGANRRALHNCGDDDDHSHTRARITNWMRGNAMTDIIRLHDGSSLTVATSVLNGDGTDIDAFHSYCNDMASSAACGGETEIASFAAMYAIVAAGIIFILSHTIVQVQHHHFQTHRCALP
jgi:hypothetical protein